MRWRWDFPNSDVLVFYFKRWHSQSLMFLQVAQLDHSSPFLLLLSVRGQAEEESLASKGEYATNSSFLP